MSEDHREQRLQEIGAELMSVMNGLTQGLQLYAPNNSAIVRLLNIFDSHMEGWFTEYKDTLQLRVVEDECFINGRLLKVDGALYQRLSELSPRLERFGWGELVITREYERAHLLALVEDIAQAMTTSEVSFSEEYGSIRVREASGSAVASFRFEPDRLAILLHSSLVSLVERLIAANARGETPSLYPLRRAFQLVIDNLRTQGGVYQLLSAARPAGDHPPDYYRRTTIAIEAASFGAFIGLEGTDLMTLALAGILGGLSPSPDPDEAVAGVFRYPGIGTFAVPVTLAIHGARSLRRGADHSELTPAASILATVEAYVSATLPAEGRAAMPMSDALLAVVKGRVKGVDPTIARLFGYFKGRYPLGSILELEDGSRGVVVGFSQDTVARPTLLPLTPDKRLDDQPRDLSKERVKIKRTLRPQQLGVGLSELGQT